MLLGLFSCQKENISINTERKIVINGLITTDSVFNVNISYSLNFSDTLVFGENSIDNAFVFIYENSILIDSLKYRPNISVNLGADIYLPSNYASKSKYPLIGHEYEIRIKKVNYPEASAKAYIPTPTPFSIIDTATIYLTKPVEYWESNVRLKCDLEVADPGNISNYYVLYVYRKPDFLGTSNMEFSCKDPIAEELKHGTMMEGLTFSDVSFNGQKHRLSLVLDGRYIGKPFFEEYEIYPAQKKIIYFRLYSVTKEYYDYLQTVNLYYKNYINPLAEATQVYSNVEGGYGIFAGAAVSIDSLVFNY
jgi:hypothetical protein